MRESLDIFEKKGGQQMGGIEDIEDEHEHEHETKRACLIILPYRLHSPI